MLAPHTCTCIHLASCVSKHIRLAFGLVCLLYWQETDEAPSQPMDMEPADLEVENEDTHVPETVRMMQMVDRDLEDLLLADDAWMMTW